MNGLSFRRLGALVACGTIALFACGARTGLVSSENGPIIRPNDGGSDADGNVVPCTPGTFGLDRATAQLMFVLDRSGSMRFLLDGTDPDPSGTQPPLPNSRWRILQRGLDPVLSSLEGRVEVGAKFFPERFSGGGGDDACLVESSAEVPPRRATASEILSVFDSTRPIGGTPTAEAIRAAAAFLKNGARRVVARYMVLATDGAPNCNTELNPRTCVCTQTDPAGCRNDPVDGSTRCLDDTRTVQVIQDAATTDKIPTFVIGLGTQDNQPAFARTLNAMAVAGGRPRGGAGQRYYEATSAAELETALGEIQTSIAECSYVTPSAPTNPNAITIEVNGVTITRDTSRRNGWDWVDQSFGQIALFGEACDAALGGGEGSKVTGTVACER